MDTNNSDYSILVLTDLSEASKIALRNATKLAKLVNGKVSAYNVQPVKQFTEEENQLSLGRKLSENYKRTQAKAKRLISAIGEEEDMEIGFTMDWGNVKNCILNKVEDTRPDMVILGRRKSKLTDLLRVGVTQFVIDNCDASILISGSDRELHSFTDLSLGFFGETKEKGGLRIIDHLQEAPRSVKYFGIRSRKQTMETDGPVQKGGTSFVFPQEGPNAIEALTSYVLGTKTQLFCIPQGTDTAVESVKEMVKRLDIPILLYK